MMYSEFIEHSNFTENYISYAEYTTCIEPIYMISKCETKYDFIKKLHEAFDKIVYPAVETAIKSLPTAYKEELAFGCESQTIKDSIAKIDQKARKIAYEYLALITTL